MSFTRRRFVAVVSSLLAALRLSAPRALSQPIAPLPFENRSPRDFTPNPNLSFWFPEPAVFWWDALPIGNGRLGGMIFGGIASERVALNEDTLWSGAPGNWNNPDAKAHLPVVRKLVLQDKNYQAADAECLKMEGPWNQAYEPLGDLVLEFDHDAHVKSYRRDLDLDSAVATVAYIANGVNFKREYIASQPENVILVRLTADKPGALTITAKLISQLQARSDSKHTGRQSSQPVATPVHRR
jgi:alpha-L-fucosidase 2